MVDNGVHESRAKKVVFCGNHVNLGLALSDSITVDNFDYYWNFIVGDPQPTATSGLEKLKKNNMVGLYIPLSEYEPIKSGKEKLSSKIDLFEWVGDYPDPESYESQVLVYMEDDGKVVEKLMTKEDYVKYVSRHTVLPPLVSDNGDIGLYRKK